MATKRKKIGEHLKFVFPPVVLSNARGQLEDLEYSYQDAKILVSRLESISHAGDRVVENILEISATLKELPENVVVIEMTMSLDQAENVSRIWKLGKECLFYLPALHALQLPEHLVEMEKQWFCHFTLTSSRLLFIRRSRENSLVDALNELPN